MNRKRSVLPALLLAFCLLVGCQTADQPHGAADQVPPSLEDTWVVTESISYDADMQLNGRSVYQYGSSPDNYRVDSYNADGTLIGYMLYWKSDNGRKATVTSYLEDGTQTRERIEEYDASGKQTSEQINRMDGMCTRQTWKWSRDGRTAEIMENGEKIRNVEYDEQGRITRSYSQDEETTYLYHPQERVMCWTGPQTDQYFYSVYRYDDQQRLVEQRDYQTSHADAYTEADLIMHNEIQYEDDGHSFTAIGTSADGTVQGSVRQIYQPFTAVQGSL